MERIRLDPYILIWLECIIMLSSELATAVYIIVPPQRYWDTLRTATEVLRYTSFSLLFSTRTHHLKSDWPHWKETAHHHHHHPVTQPHTKNNNNGYERPLPTKRRGGALCSSWLEEFNACTHARMGKAVDKPEVHNITSNVDVELDYTRAVQGLHSANCPKAKRSTCVYIYWSWKWYKSLPLPSQPSQSGSLSHSLT